ncbi:CobW family GTP-binding protein [Marinospirillum perlucidum]|uniref:CobW family GTP-binding protein n=1 Tax=Marinospirillum perlucidum TaxID=1982602 RepID=UPI000DF3D5F7|nr:GTP-binding protein [Marinospirillum perlucidum]
MSIPAHVISGFLGVGKTTAINHLLKNKPEGERWALIVNEFGQIGVDASLMETDDRVQVKEIAGGCICCALGLTLSVTLVNLLQKYQPDRLLIEPTGLGHPAGILDLLRGEQFAEFIDLHPMITLVDPRHLEDERIQAHETYRDQISLADILVFNKTDLATPEQTRKALDAASQLFPPKLALITVRQGQVPASVLQPAEQLISERQEIPSPASHQVSESSLLKPAAGLDFLAWPQQRKPVHLSGEGEGVFTYGWVFHQEDAFDEDGLYQWIDQQEDVLRLKGVFRTGTSRWQSFNRVGQELVVEPLAYRRDSRLELITATPRDAAELEAQLLALVFKPQSPGLFSD